MKTLNNNNLTTAFCIALALFVSTPAAFAQAPENAALFYYQAFLLYEKPDATMDKMLSDFLDDKIGANEVIEQFIGKNRAVIDYLVTAADTPYCDWGYDYSRGLDLMMPNLARIRRASYLIQMEAKLLSEKGDRRAALERCLSIHKMASHVADTTLIGYLTAITLNSRANSSIKGILEDMPEDLQTLNWLEGQLAEIGNRPSPLKIVVDIEREVLGVYMTREKFNEMLSEKELAVEASLLELARERVLVADEQFFVKNKDYWEKHFAVVKAALDLPYVQAFAKLNKVEEKVKKDVIEDIAATGTAILAAPFSRIYSQQVKTKTFSNAIRTAVELYIIEARTGRLPDKLPADMPKDLFSGQDFEYKKTEDGFILRCRGRDLTKGEIYQYEFKVKQ